jgi:hypothetical protein
VRRTSAMAHQAGAGRRLRPVRPPARRRSSIRRPPRQHRPLSKASAQARPPAAAIRPLPRRPSPPGWCSRR